MSVGRFLQQGAAGNAGGATYVEDVFSTYLYTGIQPTEKSIDNGIDLDGEGGLVWIKRRSETGQHELFDTERGATKTLRSNLANAEATRLESLKSFNSNGFTVGNDTVVNKAGTDFVSWTFRKQPGFFDVVTYTGDGTNDQAISHNLGSVPGMIIVKAIDQSDSWYVYHRSLGTGKLFRLDSTAAASTSADKFDVAPTSSEFYVGYDGGLNGSGNTFVAYLFAHDAQDFGTDSDESIIKCGTFTGNPVTVDLGWEPQWILLKKTDGSNDWFMYDTMRGWQTDGTGSYLQANNTSAEVFTSLEITKINSTGVEFVSYGGTWVYVAIRRPHKPAEEFAATELFAIDTQGGTSPTPPAYVSGFPVDMELHKDVTGNGDWRNGARLMQGKYLATNTTGAEGTDANMTAFDYQNGFRNSTSTGSSKYAWMFRRAPGFFDVVTYTGSVASDTNLTPTSYAHNLNVAPELIIVKTRNRTINWFVWHKDITSGYFLRLNLTNGITTASGDNPFVSGVVQSADNFQISGVINNSGYNYITYLFATVPGISKVGSYTGTGANLDVDCGFTSGARFVLVKRTDSTGDWYLWDSDRGIVAGDDPYVLLNSNAVNVTNTDYIDPDNSGFIVTSSAPAALNASGGSYLFLAIA